MNRTIVNLTVDLAAAALFLAMLGTGSILFFAMPPGTSRSLSLWGLSRHQWGDVHLWIAFAFLAVVLLHVCLHWQWVVSVVGKRLGLAGAGKGSLLRSGLPTFLIVAAVVGSFVWLTRASVQDITDPGRFDVCGPPAPAHKGGPTAVLSPGPDKLADDSRAPVSFWKDVYPVLEKACLSCHGPKRAKGGFRVDRRDDYFGKGSGEALIVPGDSSRSPLVAIVSGTRKDIARPEVHKLPEEAAALVRAWIDAGAHWPQSPDRE
jgi:hypothetical protein